MAFRDRIVRGLKRYLERVELERTVSGTWVLETAGRTFYCPILFPVRESIIRQRMRAKRPRNLPPGELPPVTKEMIKAALQGAGMRYRMAESFAQEYDCAIEYGVVPKVAILCAILAVAKQEERLRGLAHLVPPYRYFMDWPEVDEHRAEVVKYER